MRALLALLVMAGIAFGCSRAEPVDESRHVRTIENEHVSTEEMQAVSSKLESEESDKDVPTLPFSPAISMDPVDGSKVSIRIDTPTMEFDGKVYHFSSEENSRLFRENPQKYLKGNLATY